MLSLRILAVLTVFPGTMWMPSPVYAQAAAPPAVAGQDGFVVQSPDGDFRLQIGLLVQADGRFALDDSSDAVVNTFSFRRLRPYLRGRFSRRSGRSREPGFSRGASGPSREELEHARLFREGIGGR